MNIFFGVLIGGILIFWKFPEHFKFFEIAVPRTIHEYLQMSFLFISLTFAYIVTYSAIEVDSPSLVMVLTIAQAGLEGLDKYKLKQKIEQDILITNRVRDLLSGDLISFDGRLYRLRPKGAIIARIFIAYRKLLRVPKGG